MPDDDDDDPSRLLLNPILKDEVYSLKYASETNGQCTRLRIKLHPAGGPPLHYHTSYTETFTPSPSSSPSNNNPNNDNDLGIVLSSTHHRLSPSPSSLNSLTVPKGALHRFYNPYPTHPITFECELRPGNEGFEKSLSILYGLARDGLCNHEGIPTNLMQACLVSRLGDFHRKGWGPWVMEPVVWGLVKWGRRRGEEERLVARYWRG